MRLQLQRAEDLHELAAERYAGEIWRAGLMIRATCMVKVEPPETKRPCHAAAGETTRQRIGIDAGVAVEPAILVVQQRGEIQRRYLLAVVG